MNFVQTRYGSLLAVDAAIIERFEKGEKLTFTEFEQLDGAISRISHGTSWDKYTMTYRPPTWKNKSGYRTIEIRGPLTCNLTVEVVSLEPFETVLAMFTYFVFDNRAKSFVRKTLPIRNIKSINSCSVKELFPVEHTYAPVYWDPIIQN